MSRVAAVTGAGNSIGPAALQSLEEEHLQVGALDLDCGAIAW
ncbi:hypothetical protein [Nocardioides marmoriginsengisoli]|nr:hypothetical protein [Nocardioides marmoriginsengisoli]